MKALLTGATHGIGRATADALCPLADVLVLHGPEAPDDVEGQIADLRRRNPHTEITYISADYERLSDVGRLVAAVREQVDGLDLLINNAGRPGPPRRTVSADGHEVTFQANYLAMVAVTSGLLDLLAAGDGARVINVASATHYSGRLALDDLELEHGYSAVAAYAHSKLAIVTYSCWLAQQVDGDRVEVVSVHPGVISTGLLHAMFGAGGDPLARGAANLLSVAQHARGVNGVYFDEQSPAAPSAEATDSGNQRTLMELTQDMLAAAGVPTPSR